MANGEKWFDGRQIVPYQCSVRDIYYYLQDLLDRGRAFSPLSQHPLVGSFMQGVCCKFLVSRLLVPFDPLESVGLRFLSLITALLLSLSTVSCLPFALRVLKCVWQNLAFEMKVVEAAYSFNSGTEGFSSLFIWSSRGTQTEYFMPS